MLVKKLWKDPCFLFLGIYWLIGGIMNMVTSTPGISSSSLEMITVIYNMLDIPLILGILWYTSASSALARFLKIVIIIYSVVEHVVDHGNHLQR